MNALGATLVFRQQVWPQPGRAATRRRMEMTTVLAEVRRPDGRAGSRRVRLLVDSGATYSVLPARVWRALGLRAMRHVVLTLADGRTVERALSEARFRIAGVVATSPVLCGVAGDEPLLGAVTLETLGMVLNPLSRQLLPMRVLLTASAL